MPRNLEGLRLGPLATLKHGQAKKHGLKTRTYQIWESMKARCGRPSDKSWKYYGGRGITVCERWLSFENFFADMGEAPIGLTIERMNNDGNYEPGNCKWATRSEQNANRRRRA